MKAFIFPIEVDSHSMPFGIFILILASIHFLSLCTLQLDSQVGAPVYRQLRWEGKTPLPKPVVLPEGINGTIPSRDAGREIPYRVFKPASGESKGILLHIHGGGWVLQSEA